jgi:hypothetical protein
VSTPKRRRNFPRIRICTHAYKPKIIKFSRASVKCLHDYGIVHRDQTPAHAKTGGPASMSMREPVKLPSRM